MLATPVLIKDIAMCVEFCSGESFAVSTVVFERSEDGESDEAFGTNAS